jgi:hypothetical protein
MVAAAWVACSSPAPVGPGDPVGTVSPTPSPTPTPTPIPTPTPTASPSDPGFSNPDPSATPATCPTLTSWYSTIHNITDALQQPARTPMVGGHVVIDSTPLFGGRSCNAEHNFCGGRHCEDPRGGDWTLLEGTSNSEMRGDGYQMRIGPLRAGVHRWRVCPHFDAMDAEGERLNVSENPCTEGTFEVLPEQK